MQGYIYELSDSSDKLEGEIFSLNSWYYTVQTFGLIDHTELPEFLVGLSLQEPNIIAVLDKILSPEFLMVVNNNIFNRDNLIENNKVIVWDPIELLYKDETGSFSINKDQSMDITNFWDHLPNGLNRYMRKIDSLELDNRQKTTLENHVGFYGYLGYETGRYIDKHENRSDKEIIPTSIFILPANYLIISKNKIIYIHLSTNTISLPKFRTNLPSVENISSVYSNTSVSNYLEKVSKTIEYINAGDIYQANFTQRFKLHSDKEPLQIYLDFISKLKLNHHSYVQYPSFQIISLSPELFLNIYHGDVITKPIKGTRPRGASESEDNRLIQELVDSTKDQAELSMIVDLLRNDLGKSSLPGSVEVLYHQRVETYSNVHHLVSSISSKVNKNPESSWRLVLRAFPGGSITGVPKLRAMEIIEELELNPRGIYTGSIGFISLNGNAEFNIAIRTILRKNGTILFNAGGGIVSDSDPFDEYVESLHKAKHIVSYFGKTFTGKIKWINREYLMEEDVKFDDIHQKQEGFFETILVEKGRVINYENHLKRMNKGLSHYKLDISILPKLEEINRLLYLNLAENARLKIAVLVEDEIKVIMEVQPYNKIEGPYTLLFPDQSIELESSELEILEQGLKPLNYHKYRSETELALKLGYWDTVIHRGNNILETGRANIYFNINDQWYTPDKSVVQGTIRKKLIEEKRVISKSISINEMNKVIGISVSNALIGIVPVKEIIKTDGPVMWKSKIINLNDELRSP